MPFLLARANFYASPRITLVLLASATEKNNWTPGLTIKKRAMASERSKDTVKRATKACNLLCNITAKRVGKGCCAFYHPRTSKPVSQQIRFHLRVVKRTTLHSFPTRFADVWQNKLHVFCCPFYLTIKRTNVRASEWAKDRISKGQKHRKRSTNKRNWTEFAWQWAVICIPVRK